MAVLHAPLQPNRQWRPAVGNRDLPFGDTIRFQVYGSQARNTVLSVTIDREGSIRVVDVFSASS